MHTVITAECTGCELCVAPCPVDCIDMLPIAEVSETEEKQKANAARERFQARERRLHGEPAQQAAPPQITYFCYRPAR